LELERERLKNAELMEKISMHEAQIRERNTETRNIIFLKNSRLKKIKKYKKIKRQVTCYLLHNSIRLKSKCDKGMKLNRLQHLGSVRV